MSTVATLNDASHLTPWRITAANAREMALRSVAARKRAKEATALKALPMPVSGDVREEALALRVRVIERLIDQTEKAFEAAKAPKDMQALAMALDRLYGTWSLLTGHERPGVRRPQKRKTSCDFSCEGMPPLPA